MSSNLIVMNRKSSGGTPANPVIVGAKDYDNFAVLEIEIGGTKIDFYLDSAEKISELGAQIRGAVEMLCLS